jgi:hypothetical protein
MALSLVQWSPEEADIRGNSTSTNHRNPLENEEIMKEMQQQLFVKSVLNVSSEPLRRDETSREHLSAPYLGTHT